MQTGLNRRLAERGWPSLRPSQVWYPCMGCRETFCNRRELCRLLRRVDPSLCFLLPDHGAELEARMDGERIFVVKRDGDWHGGDGVEFVRSRDELPRPAPGEDGEDGGREGGEGGEGGGSTRVHAHVQRYCEPFLGEGEYKRRSELRIWLAVTNTQPLKVYYYSEIWVVLAGAPLDPSAPVCVCVCVRARARVRVSVSAAVFLSVSAHLRSPTTAAHAPIAP
jgi:hypothetical protein